MTNLLIILTDEHRRDTLACYGNSHVQMPQLNRLAQQACVFMNAHCVDPVCTPSRGSLLTGLYPHAHGAVDLNVPLASDARCLPELCQPATYAPGCVAYHGKWHLGDELYAQHGYDTFVSIEDKYQAHASAGRNAADRSDYHRFLHRRGFVPDERDLFTREFAARLPERYSKPRFLADRACRFIRQHRDRPWHLTVSMLEPHPPFFSCRNDQYDPAATPMFPNFDHVPDRDPASAPLPTMVRQRLEQYRAKGYGGLDLQSDDAWRRLTARYLGLCSLVDTHIGRILHTLEDCGLADRTVVVFTSDHGEMMGSHRLLQKRLLYREATAVPLLVRLPGQGRQVQVDGPVSHIDLLPTLLALIGQPVADHLHGRSLAPLLRQAVDEHQPAVDVSGECSECVVVQHQGSRSIISADGWRYSNYLDGSGPELYNHHDDPGERRNLALDRSCADRLASLHERLRRWQRRTGDTATLAEPLGSVTK